MNGITSRKDGWHTNVNNKDLEMFCLIWLDTNENILDSREIEQQLRSIINYLKKFKDVNHCQQYIAQKSEADRLVIIVSGQCGQKLVPSIHKLRQVIAIYVYCIDKKIHDQWASGFKKVKAVLVDVSELVSRIKADQRMQRKIEEPLSINIFTGGKSTGGIDGQFVFSQVLIDCLIRLNYNETDKNEFITCCKDQYQGNVIELNNLREFERNYSPDQALRWYTRQSFFYKTLNAALRTENIHVQFLFRAFIYDMYRQLQKYQAKRRLEVYRGQMISSDEVKTLKQCVGQFISINSFFSTSADYDIARSFLYSSDVSYNLERVLFHIDADPKMATTKPFADIGAFSEYADEHEVIFMLGSIFRLKSIDQDYDQVWTIRMTLCSDNEHDLKQILAHMKLQTGNGPTNLRILGNILSTMGKFDLAEKYLTRLLDQLPSNDPLRGNLYQDLGKLASQAGDFNTSMQWHQKALSFEEQNQSSRGFLKISPDAKWTQKGVTIAGGKSKGEADNQLCYPHGIFIDENQTLFIADWGNHRIVEWNSNATDGQVLVAGSEGATRTDQLRWPVDIVIDNESNSLIICDQTGRRIIRWSRRKGISKTDVLLENIACQGVAMDDERNLYVSDVEKHEVRRYRIGEKKGTVVAGGNGKGNRVNQLNEPNYLYVDRDYSVYVSDNENHRVMKWMKGETEGLVVAGGREEGSSLTQLSYPRGVFVDSLGTVYVAELGNHRVTRWYKGSTHGEVIVGGNRDGKGAHQLNRPEGLTFDQYGNLYIVDSDNHRVQLFSIISK